MRIFRLHIATCISLILFVISQKGYTLEPGHPDLVGYKFFETKLYLTKIWITNDEQKPVVIEAEFIMVSSKLSTKLTSKDFDRPEILKHVWLGSNEPEANALYLSHLPVKGWNHGKDVDDLLVATKSKRPEDIKQQLLRWVMRRVDRNQFRKPKVADYFNRAFSYEFPITDEFKLDTVLLEVEWRQFDLKRTVESQLYVIDLNKL